LSIAFVPPYDPFGFVVLFKFALRTAILCHTYYYEGVEACKMLKRSSAEPQFGSRRPFGRSNKIGYVYIQHGIQEKREGFCEEWDMYDRYGMVR